MQTNQTLPHTTYSPFSYPLSFGNRSQTITTSTPTIPLTIPLTTYPIPTTYPNTYTYTNTLSNLYFKIFVSYDKNNYLKKNILNIQKNNISFTNDFTNKNRLNPYELIINMIKKKKTFDITIEVSDILTIKYINVMFKKIINNLNFINACSFDNITVKFKYEEILYENHKLHISEKRKDKLKKIMKNDENIKEKG